MKSEEEEKVDLVNAKYCSQGNLIELKTNEPDARQRETGMERWAGACAFTRGQRVPD